MPIRDVAAMNASLDNDYGPTRGPNAPASHDLALFDGDPMVTDDGVELDATTAPGYARVSIPAASWAAAEDGAKALTAPVAFPAPTDAWDEASHWALFDGSVMWDCGAFTPGDDWPITAGDGPLVSPVVFYDESVTEPI